MSAEVVKDTTSPGWSEGLPGVAQERLGRRATLVRHHGPRSVESDGSDHGEDDASAAIVLFLLISIHCTTTEMARVRGKDGSRIFFGPIPAPPA
jgi:hypothetical protein